MLVSSYIFIHLLCLFSFLIFFFFNDTATTEIYTLSLHDALPISRLRGDRGPSEGRPGRSHAHTLAKGGSERDRKSTRLNSSHQIISYAVFCLKKKKKKQKSNSKEKNTNTSHINSKTTYTIHQYRR